jgi:hypothetical protein
MSLGGQFEDGAHALFRHVPHPHIAARKLVGPVRVADQHPTAKLIDRFNARFAQIVTRAVGTMYCFYLFNLLASASAKSAFASGSPTVIVNWVSSNWIQLILLPALMVGQNLQGRAADARSEATYKDAEAVLEECRQLQLHLQAQDNHLLEQDQSSVGILEQVQQILTHLTSTDGGRPA